MHHPLIVHADRGKAARGVIAAIALAVASVLAGEREQEFDAFMLLVGIVWAGVFVLTALKLAKTARSREPVLVADDAGIRAPATDVRVRWSEVIAVDHKVGRTTFDSTTHTLGISVRDGQTVDIHLDDLSMPPYEIAAAVEERLRVATAA